MAETNRKLVSGTLATTSVLVAFGVMVAVNLVASQINARIDMTENQIYTLNAASKEAVSTLPSNVEVKVFLSADMPPPLHTIRDSISDTLDEYKAASGGRLSFQIFEPKEDEEVDEDARGYGCEKVAIGQQTENEVSLRAVYKCVAFVMGDEQEVITDLRVSGIPGQDNLEYEFTKALLNLSATEVRKVGFVAGFGGPADNPQFAAGAEGAFTQLYGELLAPVSVDLKGQPVVPSDVVALVLINPDVAFTPDALFALDQFLQRGGSIAWFQSATAVDLEIQQQLMEQMRGQMGQLPEIRKSIDPGLNTLFETYGMRHNQDLVMDRANGMAYGMIMTANGPAPVSHPATFQITDIDRSLPFLANSPPVVLPAPSSITLADNLSEREDLKVYQALRSAPSAVCRQNAPTSFNAFQEFMQESTDEVQGTYLVAAAIEGVLPSYYTTNPLPEGRTEDQLVRSPKSARILIVGSGEFFSPVHAIGYDERLAAVGQQLLFSSIEWLAQDDALSTIRAKSLPKFVGEVSKERQRNIQVVNIAIVPLMFLTIGYFMFSRRRRRRNSITL